MLILGLDLALSCGWCLLRDGIVEGAGRIQLKAEGEGRVAEVRWRRECSRLEMWSEWLVRMREDYGEQLSGIAYESPNFKFMRSLSHAESYGGLRGLLIVELGDLAPIEPIMPATAKKAATGNGRAGKGQVRRAVNERFGLHLGSDEHDVADAVAVALALYERKRANAA